MLKTKGDGFFIFFVILLFLIAASLQYAMILNGDVSYLIYLSKEMLSGKTYGSPGFLETNPPLIFFLYLPVVFLEKYISFKQSSLFQFYIFSLSALSFFISFFILKKVIKEKNFLYIFSLVLLFCLLFLPGAHFGQRDHLFLIFVFPYIFSCAFELENKKISPPLALLIGVMAGFGFSMKPYFLFSFVFIECYFVFKRGRFFAWIRPESVCILTMMIAYLMSVILFFPRYFIIILPLVKTFYFIAIKEPWWEVLISPLVLFPLSACFIFVFFKNKKNEHLDLKKVLLLVFSGTLLTLLSTQTSWFYHALPLLSMACLLLSFPFEEQVSLCLKGKSMISFQALKLVSTAFFFNFIILFFHKNSSSVLLVEVYFLFLVFYFFSSHPCRRYVERFFRTVSVVLLFFVVFFIPLVTVIASVIYTIEEKKTYGKSAMFSYLADTSGAQSVLCFSRFRYCSLLEEYTKSSYVSYYSSLWWVRGVTRLTKNKKLDVKEQELKKYLFEKTAEEINYFKPHWILLQSGIRNPEVPFEVVISLFSESGKFNEAWSHYKFKTTIDEHQIYERVETRNKGVIKTRV